MEMLIQLIGSAGYPTSFIAGAIFFIFWHQKMMKNVHDAKDAEIVRISAENVSLRESRNKLEAENDALNQRLLIAETKLQFHGKSIKEE